MIWGTQRPVCYSLRAAARVVMEILGHSQIALTMNTYSHVAPEVSREAADRIAETLWRDDKDQAEEPEAAKPGDGQEDSE